MLSHKSNLAQFGLKLRKPLSYKTRIDWQSNEVQSATKPSKVHIFWELHKFLRNIHRRFVLCSNGQIYVGDFKTICDLLRIYELYY